MSQHYNDATTMMQKSVWRANQAEIVVGFTSDLKTLNGFPGQQSSFILSSASDANTTSI